MSALAQDGAGTGAVIALDGDRGAASMSRQPGSTISRKPATQGAQRTAGRRDPQWRDGRSEQVKRAGELETGDRPVERPAHIPRFGTRMVALAAYAPSGANTAILARDTQAPIPWARRLMATGRISDGARRSCGSTRLELLRSEIQTPTGGRYRGGRRLRFAIS